MQDTWPLFVMARIGGNGILVKEKRLLLDSEESADFMQCQGVWNGASRQVFVELLAVYADTPADIGDTAKISAFAAKVRRKLGMQ